MKTPEQIKEWLENQEWYPQFVELTEETFGIPSQEAEATLNGHDGKNTISCAFDWGESNEGHDYWYEIDKQFREWYDKEE